MTWGRGKQLSTIDYILSSKSMFNYILEMIVDELGKYGLGSDHNMLLLTLNIKDSRYKTKRRCKKSNNFKDWDASVFNNVDDLWKSWKSRVIKSAEESIGKKTITGKNRPWFDKEAAIAIENRKKAAQIHRKYIKRNDRNEATSEFLWQNYQQKRLIAKNLIKQKIFEMRVDKSIVIANKGGPGCKEFWQSLRGSKFNQSNTNCFKIPGSENIVTGVEE
ncbi:uncharacterized protein LOC117104229 [Anneissia japonica]|uniref:uncharacterized protein LOC117104229 n=1 Tax=Anneissia japonica TaxID=1529436 RepID=UPI0014255ED1|nr:uncharacterized protein LOC117104229 [Anneissia japonica]